MALCSTSELALELLDLGLDRSGLKEMFTRRLRGAIHMAIQIHTLTHVCTHARMHTLMQKIRFHKAPLHLCFCTPPQKCGRRNGMCVNNNDAAKENKSSETEQIFTMEFSAVDLSGVLASAFFPLSGLAWLCWPHHLKPYSFDK